MGSRNIQERIRVFLFFFYRGNSTLFRHPFRLMKVFLSLFICFICPVLSWAHPLPDIPVIGSFERNGNAVIIVEVDPRCFSEDPEEVPFLQKEAFDQLDGGQRKELLAKAQGLIKKALKIRFGKGEWFLPDFRYKFLAKEHEELILDGDVIVIRATHERKLAKNTKSYQIKAEQSAGYDLVFRNILDGTPQKRVNVLWPDEESFALDLSAFFADSNSIAISGNKKLENNTTSDTASTFYSFLRKGFVHVLPKGLDHILFVIGLFLFSRKAKPLLLQVTTFTIAHTITIALASLNFIKISPTIIEPLIALSIVYIAIENIYRKEYRHFRLISIFLFGLIHGLGFAGVSSLTPDSPSFVAELLGFTIGVDFGQLAVISIFLGLLYLLSLLEKTACGRILCPFAFNYFLLSAIALLLCGDGFHSPLLLVLWYAGIIIGSIAIQFESQFARAFGIGSLQDTEHYRKFIVCPGSAIIALIGAYWTIERIFL